MEVEWKIVPFLPSKFQTVTPWGWGWWLLRSIVTGLHGCHGMVGVTGKQLAALWEAWHYIPTDTLSIFTTIHIVSKNGFLGMSTIDQPQNGREWLPGTNHNLTFTCVPNPLGISAFLDTWGRGALPTWSRPTEQPESVYPTNILGCVWRQDTLWDSCVISLQLTGRWIKSFHWARRGPFACSGTITDYDSSEEHHGKWYGPSPLPPTPHSLSFTSF